MFRAHSVPGRRDKSAEGIPSSTALLSEWLIRQAYGFRDREYFKLKIFQLPEISCEKGI